MWVRVVGTRENVELWERTLATLKSITTCRVRLDEVEKMVNQLTAEIAESSRRGVLNNPGDVYEQLYALAKLNTTIENLRRGLEDLERLEKKLQAAQKRIEMDFMIMEQIREQLRKKLQIVVKEEKSEKNFDLDQKSETVD